MQGAWDKADTLLVVANDSLGQIPFSLLPTANLAPGKAAGLLLSQFRQTPWLARKVAIVHAPSISALVTDLFERYARDGKLTRAQALRQAMLEMIDQGVALDERGKLEHSYAHPAFWAPYALYGDPGR